jgi:2,4-dienoyl-CoA reductase-like NADH-dependent reductase (Old Yellow Enzyme family)
MMTKPIHLGSKLPFSRGFTVKNRLFKSAMSEQLATPDHNPGPELFRLYKTWAEGGIGVSVTGNVMVDRRALGEPKNVVLDEKSDLSLFKQWAEAGTANKTHLWMQLNHPGKQVPNFLSKTPVAPSVIPLEGVPKGVFNPPRELTAPEIHEIIGKFGTTARLAKEAGFTGVQIHCAHGYLLSQFLSPWHNQRKDEWGGSIENRMRILIEVYQAIREEAGEDFPVALKLNSSDFKAGGFTVEESIKVALTMQDEGIDLVEISGGTYESPNMTGQGAERSEREAYFIDYAETIRKKRTVPLVLTGGFRSGKAMNNALASGVSDMIGLARPLAVITDFPNQLISNENSEITMKRPSTGISFLNQMSMLDITWYEYQLLRIGQGKPVNPDLNAWRAVMKTFLRMGWYAFRQRRA